MEGQTRKAFESAPWGARSISPKRAKLTQELLKRTIGTDILSTRPGPGGRRMAYLEGAKVIELANESFGYSSWSHSIVNITMDYLDDHGGRFSCGFSAIVRVELENGSYHEGLGFGCSDNLPTKGSAIEKAKKSAVTDALKRSLRVFGNGLGNAISTKTNHTTTKQELSSRIYVDDTEDIYLKPDPGSKPMDPRLDQGMPPQGMGQGMGQGMARGPPHQGVQGIHMGNGGNAGNGGNNNGMNGGHPKNGMNGPNPGQGQGHQGGGMNGMGQGQAMPGMMMQGPGPQGQQGPLHPGQGPQGSWGPPQNMGQRPMSGSPRVPLTGRGNGR
ncbi:DNA repair protein Rad52 [Carpediemonas membranifera]|uniref:DNA repair protein Rad52 n=1 Tax=Carpediemonas membranifera TaxID=201153 RepID=A0A8J6APX2_9EUKA|nr:DNA repair protein Rad52 [Carpediemonas membranifera]|eukprot:KAG9390646.1 DNA repair protein Rad52 [Carpediemonas membranifera]